MRSLHYYWLATRNHLGLFVALVASTIGFCGFLTYGNPYVMSLIVDRISADPGGSRGRVRRVRPLHRGAHRHNLAGQTCSKLQDYTLWKLQIAVNYDLATMAFDCLCNQSLSFHSNRFGGTLVSQTSKFMAGYTQLLQVMNFPVFADSLLYHLHVPHPVPGGAGLCRRCSWRCSRCTRSSATSCTSASCI